MANNPGFFWLGSDICVRVATSAAPARAYRPDATFSVVPYLCWLRTKRTAPRVPCYCSNSTEEISTRPRSSSRLSEGSCIGSCCSTPSRGLLPDHHVEFAARIWKKSIQAPINLLIARNYLESPLGWQLCRTAGLASSSRARCVRTPALRTVTSMLR